MECFGGKRISACKSSKISYTLRDLFSVKDAKINIFLVSQLLCIVRILILLLHLNSIKFTTTWSKKKCVYRYWCCCYSGFYFRFHYSFCSLLLRHLNIYIIRLLWLNTRHLYIMLTRNLVSLYYGNKVVGRSGENLRFARKKVI